jgi:hypothetical protein
MGKMKMKKKKKKNVVLALCGREDYFILFSVVMSYQSLIEQYIDQRVQYVELGKVTEACEEILPPIVENKC